MVLAETMVRVRLAGTAAPWLRPFAVPVMPSLSAWTLSLGFLRTAGNALALWPRPYRLSAPRTSAWIPRLRPVSKPGVLRWAAVPGAGSRFL